MSAGQFTDGEVNGQEEPFETLGGPGQVAGCGTPGSASLPPGYRLRRGRNWFFLGLTYASYYLCRYNLAIIAPELKGALGLTNAQYGWIQSGRNGAYAVGQIVNGLFTDRLGGKQAMTLGAIGTILLNLLFGLTAWSKLAWLFYILLLIRLADGYIQAFGSPGFVKINTAWFRRNERGGFSGIFGGMIQLGQIGANYLASFLASGFFIPLLFFSITVPKLDWRYMFVIPPGVIAVIILLMNLMVKNHPEEAGYHITHEDEVAGQDPNERVELRDVFRKIVSNKIVWIVAAAYFCTGFVRSGINEWWTVYLTDVWAIDKKHSIYYLLASALPITAFVGSFASGMASDKLFGGRRAPVATVIYLSQTVFTAAALLMSLSSHGVTPMLAAVLLIGMNTACNASHSILGTAAAMDLGGRKMAGFAAGVIDSFQYFGAMFAGFGLGKLIDLYRTVPIGTTFPAGVVQHRELFNSSIWFAAMLPWGILGTVLMVYLWIRYSRTNTRGA